METIDNDVQTYILYFMMAITYFLLKNLDDDWCASRGREAIRMQFVGQWETLSLCTSPVAFPLPTPSH